MAIFRISPATSRYTFTNNTPAFGDPAKDDSPGADTLIVGAGAYLIATGINSDGAVLPNTNGWTVAVNGMMVSTQSHGLVLGPGAGASTVTIGTEGQVGGLLDGMLVETDTVIINNAGVISGGVTGIELDGNGIYTITSSGTISGSVAAIADGDVNGADKVTNSGTLNGNVNFNAGNDSLNNSGTIEGDIAGGAGNDVITNSKLIKGSIDLGGGTNRLVNSGEIDEPLAGFVKGGGGDDTIINSGRILGGVELGDGTNKFVNLGILSVNVDAAAATTRSLTSRIWASLT
jgi:hypothetical protein